MIDKNHERKIIYANLKSEFIFKLGRDLKDSEKEFLKWMAQEYVIHVQQSEN